jgi:hypothetical protein
MPFTQYLLAAKLPPVMEYHRRHLLAVYFALALLLSLT